MDTDEKIKDLQALRSGHSFRDWKPYMEKYNCDTVCEIGVRKGDNFKKMIEHAPKLAVAVDSWINDGVVSRNDMCYTQANLDKQYEEFKSEMADKPFVKICRGISYNVVKEFEDEFFDFIYIDADHTYEAVTQDIADWYPKVKKGGVLCGHDYVNASTRTEHGIIRYGVKRAVNEFVEANKIGTFFLLKRSVWGLIK